MDSGSGSIQSSSGGDEEYDSHHQQPELIQPSSFLNNLPSSHFISSESIPQPRFHLPHTYNQNLQPYFFDFSSNYNLNPNSTQDSSLIHLDPIVRPPSSTIRPEPNLTTVSSPGPHGSSHGQTQVPFRAALHPKPTKKRTRASRRAPTTILTTDTSNFRAMVQEFTGIPAPPFSTAGSSFSRRFDLFGSRSSATHLEGSGSALYPLRPKVQLFTSSTNVPPLLNNSNVMAASTSYQLLSSDDHHLGLTKEPQTTSFQSLSGHEFNSKQVQQGTNLEQHIHGGSQLLSVLQSDEMWRSNNTERSNNASNVNCKLNFSGS